MASNYEAILRQLSAGEKVYTPRPHVLSRSAKRGISYETRRRIERPSIEHKQPRPLARSMASCTVVVTVAAAVLLVWLPFVYSIYHVIVLLIGSDAPSL